MPLPRQSPRWTRRGPVRWAPRPTIPRASCVPAARVLPQTASPFQDSARGKRPTKREPAMASLRSWIAVGIRGRISAFQMYLVQAVLLRFQKEIAIQAHATSRVHIQFGHPTADAFRIKLLIPGAVE